MLPPWSLMVPLWTPPWLGPPSRGDGALFEKKWPSGLAAPPGYTQADVSALPVASGATEIDFAPSWTTPPPGVLLSTRILVANVPTPGIELYGNTDDTLHFLSASSSASNTDMASSALTWVSGQRYVIRAVWGSGNLALYRDGTLVASITDGSANMPASHAELDVGFIFVNGFPQVSAMGTFYRVAFFAQ